MEDAGYQVVPVVRALAKEKQVFDLFPLTVKSGYKEIWPSVCPGIRHSILRSLMHVARASREVPWKDDQLTDIVDISIIVPYICMQDSTRSCF